MNHQTFYQEAFIALRETGRSVSESVLTILHKYLDGKPAKKGRKKLRRTDRDAALWKSTFWSEVSTEVFETETFSLALARYLRQKPYTHHGLLQNLFKRSPNSLRYAIKYSQIFLSTDNPRWQEIEMLNTANDAKFCSFLDACRVLEEEWYGLELHIQAREKAFEKFSVLEILVYASLYTFKHLLVDGQSVKDAETSQRQMEALNQILLRKLKQSVPEDFQLTECSLGELLKEHMSPFLFTQEYDITHYRRCEYLLDAFEQLLSAHLAFNYFEGHILDWFCFDKDTSFRFEGEKLMVDYDDTSDGRHWDENGKKLAVLPMYWFYRADKEFFLSGLIEKQFGLPENHEFNQLAYKKALRTMLQLYEVYGLDQEIIVTGGVKINLFKLLHSLELMSVFYLNDFILAFEENYKRTGHWQAALAQLAFDGLANGMENRFPITFAEQDAKVERIQSWTVTDTYPQGSKKTAKIILDFWTNDLSAQTKHLHQKNQTQAPFPELYERPILKIGRYLFTLPWLMFNQDNATSAINNLRRIGRHRKERMTETRRIEIRLAELFETHGFRVVSNYEPPKEFLPDAGEVDLICARDGHLFIFEIKSGYFRKTLKAAWLHKTNTLRKAGLQLTRKKEAVLHGLETRSSLMQDLGLQRHPCDDHIHCWILDTSLEYDHEHFSDFLKVSIQEVLIALRDERHLLRAAERFSLDKKPSVSGTTDAETFYDEFVGKQASDTLYPDVFSAERFVYVIESGLVWKS
ncbi:MAG: hypothetical protein SRB2_03691 [Desulfobacteraceae bacterium Eth-SRB2]|nr:MAG: hypothetical protein SRB2_03691 [Desulfobacteraceae bacterium Eth-SRB2]